MPIPLEAWTWTEEQLLQEIAIRLPKGWGIEFGQAEDRLWHLILLDEAREPAWKGDEVSPNLVLFDALGWLDLRGFPVPTDSPWKPRPPQVEERPHEALNRLRTEDPPDLDPSEIEALVYSSHSRKR